MRQTLGRQPDDDMLEIDVNMVISCIFMSATMKAAVHLGQDYEENLRTTRNTDFDKIPNLFDMSWKLIGDQNQENMEYLRLKYNSMCDKHFIESQSLLSSCQQQRLLLFGTLYRRQNC